MKTTALRFALVLAAATAAGTGCASPALVPAPGTGYEVRGPMGLIEAPTVAPPANDIPESQRRAWLDAQRPKPAPVPVERVVVREREPSRRVVVRDHDRYDDWVLPLSLSFGWWGGRHRGHGWGWGLGWSSRWGHGWCW